MDAPRMESPPWGWSAGGRPAPDPPTSAALGQWCPAIAAFCLAGLLYACTLWGSFVVDDVFVVGGLDPRISSISQWPRFLTQAYIPSAADHLWRPLTSLSFAIQYQISGTVTWPLHAVNVLAHAGVAALVAELARRMAGLRAAWVAGLLFAAHPVHVDAVAYLVGRAESFCALGTLGAMVLLLHRPLTAARAWGIFGCFVVALLSKEQGMLVPVLLLVLAGVQRWRRGAEPLEPLDPRERRAARWLIVLLTWGLSAYLVYRQSILPFLWDRDFLDWIINPLVRSHGLDRALVPLALLGRYAQLLVAPWRLSADYGAKVILPTQSLDDPYLYLGLLAAAAWAAGMVWSLVRRKATATFCLLAIALTYGMVSNLAMLIGTVFGERLLYLPSVFLLLLVGQWAARLPSRWLGVAMAVVLVFFSLRTVSYAARWNDRLEFLRSSVAEQPRSVLLHLLLIEEELRQGPSHLAAAEAVAAEARRLAPESRGVWEKAAAVARGRHDAAKEAYYLGRMQALYLVDARAFSDRPGR